MYAGDVYLGVRKRVFVVSVLTGAALSVVLAQTPEGTGPLSSAQTGQSAAASSAATSVEVTGRVVNGRTHAAIARALVQMGNRRVLTDHDGIFRFPEVTSASASFRASKPGFFAATEEGPHPYALPATTPMELTLYPEAILSGTVIDTSGEPVPHTAVVARSSVYNDTGHHWFNAGRTQTLSDGTFRLSLAAGSYALQMLPGGRPVAGTDMLQPLAVPAGGAIKEAIRLAPGDQVHLTLRPSLRRAYDVALRLDHAPDRGFPMVTARPANGPAINLTAVPNRDDPGVFHVALPNGTYELVADLQSPEGREQGRTSVTVAGHDVAAVSLPLVPVPVFPVVVEVESAATSDNALPAPKPQQLGVVLTSVVSAADFNEPVNTVSSRGSEAPSIGLPEGVYRFHATAGGVWYVTGASCGGTDLLQQNLAVAHGAGGTEIRLRVSNRTADLTGTVQVGDAPGAAWVYLIATEPAATPIVLFRSGSGGGFLRPYLAPGSYRVVALERQATVDLQDAEALGRFGARVQTLTVHAGDHATLNLNAVPATELAR